MSLFKKILIANRGEIARRIIKTCHALDIDTVAIYSDADKDSLFVTDAKESVNIGESQASKSYLNIEKVIQAAKETGADAIHPGYGFLAENSEFVKRCEEENIIFIGPSAKVIEAMGDKLTSRSMMAKVGVPVVPGSEKSLDSIEEAKKVANNVGYPLMLKASAGGGGIGIVLLNNESELEKNFDPIKQQAKNFFGNDTVFIEKFIKNPRHIEVQVAADEKGNTVHLYERECSVQRRHQKVVEEAPSPSIDEETRKELLETAVRGVESINYRNLGTVEFIFDDDENFYFLEMNTRLQVEHPVTEEITGLDLVEWQIKIAAGENLPLKQEEISVNGHAIECRVCAEDPNTFFPSPGTITEYKIKEELARYDFGVESGKVISPFYDSMIGKMITHGRSRDAAIDKMKTAIKETQIEGIKTNLPLQLSIMNDEIFQSGSYTTNFLEERKKIKF